MAATEIVEFDGDYESISNLYGRSASALAERDRGRSGVRRWVAFEKGLLVAAAEALARPDQRILLWVRGNLRALGPLTDTVASSVAGRLCVNVDSGRDDLLDGLRTVGFQSEVTVDSFRVSFEAAMAAVDRAWTPSGVELITVDEADRDKLYALDVALRRDVPGSDGWLGDRALFDAEFEDEDFDPSGYVAAVEIASGEYSGLFRMWRRSDEPRLGLLGVTRPRRNTVLAAALLKEGLAGAANWGSPTFTTSTSRVNRAVHRRLARIGGQPLTTTLQMVRG